MKMHLRIATIEVESDSPETLKAVIDSVREAFGPSVPALAGGKKAVALLPAAAGAEPPPEEPAGDKEAPPANKQTEDRVIAYLEEQGEARTARKIAMEGLGWKASTTGFKGQLVRMVERGQLYSDDGCKTFEIPIKDDA